MDDSRFGEAEFPNEESQADCLGFRLFDSLALRLVLFLIATGIVILIGLVAPPWAGLIAIPALFLPILIWLSIHHFSSMLAFVLVMAFNLKQLKWKAFRALLAGAIEECVVVLTGATLVAWLL